jgi:hypothetical protein
VRRHARRALEHGGEMAWAHPRDGGKTWNVEALVQRAIDMRHYAA